MIQQRLKGCQKLSVLLEVTCLWCVVGCSTMHSGYRGFMDRIEERQSYISWNFNSAMGKTPDFDAPRSVQLASLTISQLKELLSSCPPPCLNGLEGKWAGINRGIGPAIAGKTQYIKELHVGSSCPGTIGHGSNILVESVPISHLCSEGWRPKVDLQTGTVERQGHYAIVAREKMEIDYSLVENPFWEPTRFLVDELVQVDDGLLLGRAYFRMGSIRIPVAYFAVEKVSGTTSQ